jgi:hypothetical protein
VGVAGILGEGGFGEVVLWVLVGGCRLEMVGIGRVGKKRVFWYIRPVEICRIVFLWGLVPENTLVWVAGSRRMFINGKLPNGFLQAIVMVTFVRCCFDHIQ